MTQSQENDIIELLNTLDYVLSTPQEEDTRKDVLRDIVYKWRKLKIEIDNTYIHST
ncbi:MAG: hypothetical protein PHF86_15135 [Candidatus Nanoarchaeia archaeon]|jgi:hypothetical protein|nr:hypothetical protein [Candidatus Nanoarchaeia archaeon]